MHSKDIYERTEAKGSRKTQMRKEKRNKSTKNVIANCFSVDSSEYKLKYSCWHFTKKKKKKKTKNQ